VSLLLEAPFSFPMSTRSPRSATSFGSYTQRPSTAGSLSSLRMSWKASFAQRDSPGSVGKLSDRTRCAPTGRRVGTTGPPPRRVRKAIARYGRCEIHLGRGRVRAPAFFA
jgi:hypothetical protein